MNKLSIVLNTCNEAENLEKALKSVKDLASEIVVVDMESTDDTVKIAKKFGAKVYTHKRLVYVEPARNFAIEKVTSDWILLMDPDEEIGRDLKEEIQKIISDTSDVSFYRLPRKNIIFGKWIQHTLWWPDYQIRLFRKGIVNWSNEIHSTPVINGKGVDFPGNEKYAIIHNNYQFIDQYLEKLIRYTTAQAEKSTEKFDWRNLIKKPVNEFVNRYFNGKGYLDGVHGLALSLLQSFSELVVVVKIWQKEKFKNETISESDIKNELFSGHKIIKWWMRKEFSWLRKLVSV